MAMPSAERPKPMAAAPPTVAATAARPEQEDQGPGRNPPQLPARLLVDDRADDRHEDQRNDRHFQQTHIDLPDETDPPHALRDGPGVEPVQKRPERNRAAQRPQHQNIEGDLFPLQDEKAGHAQNENADTQNNHNPPLSDQK